MSTAVTNGSTNYPKWGLSWIYDQYNNRTAQSVTVGTAPATSLSFNPATNQPGGYSYDADGNLTVEPLAPPNQYGYDAEDDLVSYEGGNGNATYTYDGHGLRVQESTQGGLSTVYIFSGTSDIAEYDNNALPASPSREFIYGGGQALAQVSAGVTNYLQSDHLSVRMITDSSGNIAGQQGHFPFGEAWYASNTTTSWIFTSYERDSSESGLDYAMARFYDSRIGGFCSVDPLEGRPQDPLSWNRYAYVENDPINLTDPSGKGFWSWLVRIFTAIVELAITFFSGGSVPAIVPTFGGGIDLLTLFPGYNPHMAMTPTFLATNISPSLSSWAAATATNNGPASADAAALGVCTSSIFGVSLKSFTASEPGKAGSFTGIKAGVWTGFNQSDAVGPFQFTVVNDVSKTKGTLAFMDSRQNPDAFMPGEVLNGYTDGSHPFRNWTGSDIDPSKFVSTQIFELGNSLGSITHMPLPEGPRRLGSDPKNQEPGSKLLTCYNKNAGS